MVSSAHVEKTHPAVWRSGVSSCVFEDRTVFGHVEEFVDYMSKM